MIYAVTPAPAGLPLIINVIFPKRKMNNSENSVTTGSSKYVRTVAAAFVITVVGGAVQGGLWSVSGVCSGVVELEGCPTFVLVKQSALWLILLTVPLSIIPARLDLRHANLWMSGFVVVAALVRFGFFHSPQLILDAIFFLIIVVGVLAGRYVVFLLEKRQER